jgi:hypothetical protein
MYFLSLSTPPERENKMKAEMFEKSTPIPICRECLKPIENPRTPNTLLHDDCKVIRKRKREHERFKNMGDTHIGEKLMCPHCEAQFQKTTPKQRYCTPSCQYLSKLAKAKKKDGYNYKPYGFKTKEKVSKEETDQNWPAPEAPALHPMAIWFVTEMARHAVMNREMQ